jgi:hypothetical protein
VRAANYSAVFALAERTDKPAGVLRGLEVFAGAG